MSRVKRGVMVRKRHKRVLKLTKGFRGARSRQFRQAKLAVLKSGLNAYRDRRLKKRTFRRLWITRINAALRSEGMQYSRFIYGLMLAQIKIDRKNLAELAVHHRDTFKELVEIAKKAVGQTPVTSS